MLVHLASFLFSLLLMLQNVNELLHKKSAPQSLQMLTIMTAFISPVSSPLSISTSHFTLLRGGKGNNLFYYTKTFFPNLKTIYYANDFLINITQISLTYYPCPLIHQ